MPSPLFEKVKPISVDQIVGQKHILNSMNFLNEISDPIHTPNMIFYGPPGTGKTTLAGIIATKTNKKFIKLNATNSTVSEIKEILHKASYDKQNRGIIICLDEIQYFNKKQQQSLLEFMDNGLITLIASTTENPYFCIYPAILSRSHVFEFKSVSKEDIITNLKRVVKLLEEEYSLKLLISEKTLNEIATLSCGDIRKSINLLELGFLSRKKLSDDTEEILLDDTFKKSQENFLISHNNTNSDHYDLLSALQKSLRGSDPDASMYYLARLLYVGEVSSVCRRLLVCVCEDVGLAYPAACEYVKTLTDIALQVGMPEARNPLANAALIIALSPKSNSAYNAINLAMQDIKKGLVYSIPKYLKSSSPCSSSLNNLTYNCPHNYPNNWIPQAYLPEELTNKKYYYPQKNKNESAFENYWNKIKNKNSNKAKNNS